jgi:hypothetical protein
MTVDRIRKLSGEAAAALYSPLAAADGKIQLECSSCHKLDSGRGGPEFERLKKLLDATGEPTRGLLPPRAQGAYYLPVNFDAHCRSCHPLAAPEVSLPPQKEFLPRFEVVHRRQPRELVNDLKAGYLKGLIAAKHPLLAARPLPGGRIDSPLTAASQTLAREVEVLVSSALQKRKIFSGASGCAKCHQTRGNGDIPEIVPVPDRTVWLTHARFNHAAHRGATCASCHPGTAALPGGTVSPGEAAKPEPVQILGLESCRACHSPLGARVKLDGAIVSGGGVRHNCTDCHGYHHGDLPLQGRGSDTALPKQPRDIAGWLKAE